MADQMDLAQLQQLVNAQNNLGGQQPTPQVVPFSKHRFMAAVPVTKPFDETTVLLRID